MSLFSSLLVVLIRDVLMFHRAVDPALYIRFLAASWILVYVIIKRMHLAWVKQYNITVCHFIFTLRVFFFFLSFSIKKISSRFIIERQGKGKKKKRIRNCSSEKISFPEKILILYYKSYVYVCRSRFKLFLTLLKSYRIVCTNTRPICLWKCQSM